MNDPVPPSIPPITPPASHHPPPSRRRQRGCLVGCLAALVIGIGLAVLGVMVLRTVAESFAAQGENPGNDDFPGLTEVWTAGDGPQRVARIHVNGVIQLNSGRWWSDQGSPDLALAGIRRATRDGRVRGLILEVNSPGGGITASDILHNALLEFKAADPGRRVLVLMHDLAASGAYYIACAADEIIAHPTTLTGSIGVIMQSYNIHRLAETIGVTDVTVKSGANKDLLNPFRPVNDGQVETLVQPLVDTLFARFLDVVAKGRGIPPETLRPLADGRLFDAQSALDNKLVDAIGYRARSEARMAELLGAPVTIFRYEESFRLGALFRQSLMRYQRGAGIGAELKSIMDTADARFMYLWRP